mmetsp:Transcript_24389/g.51447  ORF Transcript_24389/g.51447 Transcript_24389/m.51447 type:complete len:132 (+) Transcript_24389:465-860(+)
MSVRKRRTSSWRGMPAREEGEGGCCGGKEVNSILTSWILDHVEGSLGLLWDHVDCFCFLGIYYATALSHYSSKACSKSYKGEDKNIPSTNQSKLLSCHKFTCDDMIIEEQIWFCRRQKITLKRPGWMSTPV